MRLGAGVGRLFSRGVVRSLVVAVPTLVVATAAVALLQDGLGVANPSALYLVAVVATAIVAGTWSAVSTAMASFLLYNFLFVEPRHTLTVGQPAEVVNLLLLLFVGVVVGELTALQRARADAAVAREREARALFQVSRALATRASTVAVLGSIAGILRQQAGMGRVWIALGGDDATERVAADTSPDEPREGTPFQQVLQRTPGDAPARWLRLHVPTAGRPRPGGGELHRVRIEAAGQALGSLWAHGDPARGVPDRAETRLFAATADQIGQALRQDRLAAEAQAAEIARQSDALKSALLQSVSHDLRTPLATIRAAAGSLRPGGGLSTRDQVESVAAIDREVDYLNRIVTNLLDLSRIEAGALRAEPDVLELDDALGPTLARLRQRLGDRPLDVELDVPPVRVDPIFLDEALTNVLDNAVKYTPPGTRLRVSGRDLGDGFVRLAVEDGGPGVPAASLPRLFEKFYRVPGGRAGSRAGTGIGLAVVRGLVESMGGRVEARASQLGGLAIDLDLPLAPAAIDLVAMPT